MTEYRFDWQAQGGAAGRTFEGWLLPTLLAGKDWDTTMELLREKTKDWSDVVVTVQVNGEEVNARGFFTTIDMNLQELGQAVAHELIDAIKGHPHPGLHRVPVRLIPRASTTRL